MTPLVPTPELREIYEARHRHPEYKFYRLNSARNTALAPGFLERFIKSEVPELRQTRLTGEFASLGNACFRREWFQYYDDLDDAYKLGDTVVKVEDCHRMVTVDLAITVKASADWTVAQVGDITPHGHMVLVHEWRIKVEGPGIISGLCRINERFKPVVTAVESVAFQKIVVQMLR